VATGKRHPRAASGCSPPTDAPPERDPSIPPGLILRAPRRAPGPQPIPEIRGQCPRIWSHMPSEAPHHASHDPPHRFIDVADLAVEAAARTVKRWRKFTAGHTVQRTEMQTVMSKPPRKTKPDKLRSGPRLQIFVAQVRVGELYIDVYAAADEGAPRAPTTCSTTRASA
jgi:hypothetical protein